MADRRSVFSNEAVIEAATSFVCAADEVWRLQRGSEEDCVFFQRAVNGGERITDRGTRQGTWIFAPGGKLLAHINTRNVEAQLTTLAKGLAAFEELGPEERKLPSGLDLTPEHRWESSFPEDGLALERIARDLEGEGIGTPVLERWNRDFVWVSAGELQEALPGELTIGTTFQLDDLAERLARFHIVDNVRGQTLPFAKAEIPTARLSATVVAKDEESVRLELHGETASITGDDWLLGDNAWTPKSFEPHGIRTEIIGRATLDRTTKRFASFELIALGERWGSAGVNARSSMTENTRVAFHFTKTDRRIAPAFVDVYDADWIAVPEHGTWRDSPEECEVIGE